MTPAEARGVYLYRRDVSDPAAPMWEYIGHVTQQENLPDQLNTPFVEPGLAMTLHDDMLAVGDPDFVNMRSEQLGVVGLYSVFSAAPPE